MRVSVVRSGGFAGVERRAEADTAEDPALEALVSRSDLDSLPPRRERRGGGDRFVYEIDLDGRTVTVGESQLTEPLRELVGHLFRS
ncbi:protealysin inhibitor emfourin [Actinocorallia populi]|uniref:protealysin inhibitor emfourin n=1 Tax=Actinocorallia populi TaxID=2079200 RepID=UPI000D090A98|nr:protealysin inhibitor emfourin [Actinocorallia populi]